MINFPIANNARVFLLPGKCIWSILLIILCVAGSLRAQTYSSNPNSVTFHTEDIHSFWEVFDSTSPKFSAKVFQEAYIDKGSKGLHGFIRGRIESGKHLSKVVKSNLDYYKSIRGSSLSIDARKERFYECFRKLQEIYPEAVFPDVYFVIGAKNSGGTVYDGGLIIGAEMFGDPASEFKPPIDVESVDKVITHELIHF